MKQKFNSGGRPPKINSTAFRCSVNFTVTEQAQLLTMQEKSGIASLSAFIKMRVFDKPFKVFVVDENTRVFIDKMSSQNAHYRTIAIDYDLLLRTLRESFTEKKAMTVLPNLSARPSSS
ncbi:MobA protein [Bacteroides acidifaciens]|uniref:plasmid mobilization protein n=1 Tax=Bacteroides acidifaciens TaxID=85831 RepID=UPI0025A9A490|nr:MobA protein [Bacteroides acidifaciens]